MPDADLIPKLQQTAARCRIHILEMLCKAKSGHPGGSLSVIDLLVALYCAEMKHDPKRPDWDDRDRCILSKGHGVPALYAVLAELGSIAPSELATLRQIDSRLQGHPDRVAFPWAEASTGSLGQGLSIAQGIALGLKHLKKPSRVYCVLGDGETQEGQIWETAMSAPKFGLNNLVAITDCNNGQIDGRVEDVMNLEPLGDKWKAFRWNVLQINGHNFGEILGALKSARGYTQGPTMILARTVKGKGVSFMENNIGWHGVAPDAEQTRQAVEEIRRGMP